MQAEPYIERAKRGAAGRTSRAHEIGCAAKKVEKVVDTGMGPAYTNVTDDAVRGAPITVL